MNKYFMNFILCGDADYLCLLCNENFHNLTDVEKHIRWEKHRKILKEQIVVAKFKNDFIFMISEGYYCKACNCIISPVSEVIAHISDEKHKVNIKTPVPDKHIENALCRYNCGYVIVSNIIVTEHQWHSIVTKMCLICHRYINPVKVKQHINSTAHMLNIIKSRIIKHQDDYYRKIDDELFYCFICKSTFVYETFEGHWTDQGHCDKKSAVIGRVTASDVTAEQKKKKELAKKLIDTQRIHFDVDETKQTAQCKICKLEVKLDFKSMLDHNKGRGDAHAKIEAKTVQAHGSSDEEEPEKVVYMAVQDYGKRRSELSKYGKVNYIKLNEGGSRGYCSLCHSSLSAGLRVFKEHVKGARHKGHLELKGLKSRREHKVPKAKCVPITKYLDTLFYSQTMRVVWVNKNVCFDAPGFVLMAPVRKPAHFLKTKCFVCDVVYADCTEDKHYQTEEHKRRFLAAKVVAEKADEFVREIRPDLYHCAICNKVLPFWELMDKHLNTWRHFEKKHNTKIVHKLLMQWYNGKDEVLTKCSKNPDILYVQTLYLGLFSE